MAVDPELLRHREWLGLLQPEGLVVSPPALADAQAFIDRGKMVERQMRLQALTSEQPLAGQEAAWVPDFVGFAEQVLGWETAELVTDLPESLEVVLTDYGETLKPTYGVSDPDSDGWLLLIQEIPAGHELDKDDPAAEHGWRATYQQKFERLLKGAKVPIGVLWNGTHLRLVYAPQGESSGHLTFPIQAMTEVPGRLILGALEMLLGSDRLFNAPSARTLPKLLEKSRKYQAEVSTQLAEQVLDALWELLRGFQAADADRNGELLRQLAAEQPQHIYGGLITTLMRLVFLLYAEDQGLMPDDEVYQGNYSLAGLYSKLRENSGNHPDTMYQRYGAWGWLLSLFRLVYDGGGAHEAYLPARHGQLFDPDEYPFLEGRPQGSRFKDFGKLEAPRVTDGAIYQILEKLLILKGERLSYRALDVEQIGSVYEAIMGYEVRVAKGVSIGVKPKDVVINLELLLAEKPVNRTKALQKWAECKLADKAAKALKEAKTPAELVAALDRRVSHRTKNLLPAESLYLQPGEERRRSGSHYTPRKLTQPIVETTLRPIFEGLGEHPTAEQILDLKVCDLAMGSAAFLVEACRQLAENLVEAWDYHGQPAPLPNTLDPLLYARRLVAQRCLYGVDKNPFAVNLAKLSLWLVTLSKDQPFTFVDHALKCGDSLVGLTRAEIGSFGKDPTADLPLMQYLKQQLAQVKSDRTAIQAMDTRTDAEAEEKRTRLWEAEQLLAEARLVGDVKVAAFFEGSSVKERKEKLESYAEMVRQWRFSGLADTLQEAAERLRGGQRPVPPFSWEIEFPEVFDRENPGFDAIVGNPPFAGKNTTINATPEGYLDWLKDVHPESHGNADLVAHFFRRAFTIIRQGGSLGLIATNTIAQGDTRSTGLRFICSNGGTIYNAQKRVKWPGLAAVVVSVVNIFKGSYVGIKRIDSQETDLITAFLFHAGGNNDPAVLLANADKSFLGSCIIGMGFTFDDSNPEASPLAEMHCLIEKDHRNAKRIFPYIGGEEVNSSPTHAHHRYVINFGEMSEEEARHWPDLMAIVEEKVKPERDVQKRDAYRLRWWQYAEKRPGLVRAMAQCERVLVISRVGQHGLFTFLPSGIVYSEQLIVIPLPSDSAFCTLQSRVHEIWVRFFGSSMKDDLRYTSSDCFETFPFPTNWETNPKLEAIGKTYYEYRAELMVRNNQGLTDTYNRFHDPDERDPDILKLRDLHEQMDRAVLDAYGWHDIPTTCEFILDYDEENDGEALTPNPSPTGGAGSRKRKKPWRYRWPEAVHDEVLARLLDLNQKRHEQEILDGKQSEAKSSSKATGKTTKAKKPPKKPQSKQTPPLIPGMEV
jgi:hypothetical protein